MELHLVMVLDRVPIISGGTIASVMVLHLKQLTVNC